MGDADQGQGDFRTARQLMAAGPARAELERDAGTPIPVEVVAPIIGIDAARKLWNNYLAFRDAILSDPACADDIDGSREMNRTGAMRLALPFGLSIEERSIEEGRIELLDTHEFDYRFRVRVRVSRGSRFVDGIGSCRLSEISPRAGDLSRREHFALTKAYTRASKRAIADMLGGTEAD